ncbi:14153_t:CDS:2, partial [Racocetra fulgida]
DEVNLDDLCTFFSNINSKSLSVLLEIVIPYNAQVVSKSIQFDEFGNPEKIETKNLKNLISYNTLGTVSSEDTSSVDSEEIENVSG